MGADTRTRVDRASSFISASSEDAYAAFIDPKALVAWLPPRGMRARVDVYEPRAGGMFRLELIYEQPDHSAPGKTSAHTDVVRGRFLEVVPNERIVQAVQFESEDPALAGEMTMTWTFTAVAEGIEVAIRAENVPPGIRPEDHEAGFRSTLDNLAAYIANQRMWPDRQDPAPKA